MSDSLHTLGNPAELAELYLSGGMAADERRAYEAHLAAGCASCDEELRAVDALVAALALSVEPVTPGNVTRIEVLAGANDKLGELSSQDVEDVATLVAEVRKNLSEVLQASRQWEPLEPKGLYMRTLRLDKKQSRLTALMRMDAGVTYPPHVHQEGEQCIVLHGELQIADRVLQAGEYRWWHPGEPQPMQTTRSGCLLLVSSPLD